MEKTQPTTGQFALRYGLLLGAIGIVFSMMLHFMDMQYDQSINVGKTIISLLILAAIIIVAVIQFKKANEGYISLSEALKVGIGAALIGAIIAVLFTLLYVNVIEPDFKGQLAEVSKTAMIEQNPELTQEQLDNAIEMQQKFFWITYPIILIFNLFAGFVIALITGLIVKKSKDEF